MRIAYHSEEMATLSWARRLVDEGHDVLVYNPTDKGTRLDQQRHIGTGIVPLARSREEWMSHGMADPTTLWFFDCTDRGELADRLRRTGRRVVGAGSFMDRLENDRGFGTAFAKRCGITCPPERTFTKISSAIAWLKTNPQQESGDGGWAWKPNQHLGCDCTVVAKNAEECIAELTSIARSKGDTHTGIVQERIPGVAMSTNWWWNGNAFVGPALGTLEKKKLMNDDVGPSTGCALNLVWMYTGYPKAALALQFERVGDAFRRVHAPPGLYDINAVFNRRGAWFLEWTPRLGIDSELASQRGITKLGAFLERLATGGDVTDLMDSNRNYLSIRLSVPPYPGDDLKLDKSPSMGVPVRGIDGLWDKHFVAVGIAKGSDGYEVADPNGFVGVALASGDYLKAMSREVLHFCKKLQIRGLQYRTDAADAIGEDLDFLSKTGWSITEVDDAAA